MDSLIQSLLRGRMLATVSSAAAVTAALNDATAAVTALLALVSALASLYSKLREIRQGRAHG